MVNRLKIDTELNIWIFCLGRIYKRGKAETNLLEMRKLNQY